MSVSFRFDNLEYQRQAVNSVISLLEGQSQDANKNTQEFTKKDTNPLSKRIIFADFLSNFLC